jgi:hypothetical protein
MTERTRKGNEASGGIVSVLIAGGLMFALQADIANWKAANSLREQMQVITNPEAATSGQPVIFYTGLLTATTLLTDQVHGLSLPQVAGVKVTEEEYRHRRRSSDWRTVNTYTQVAGARVGGIALSDLMLSRHAREVWEAMPLSRYESQLRRGNGAYISGSTYYTSSRHRYRYQYIRGAQEVTAVGAIAHSADYGEVLSPAPGMPDKYPALWPGKLEPAAFLDKLQQRMLTVIIGGAGALTLIGWFIMVMMQAIFGRSTVSPAPLLLGALGAAAAGMMIWFITVNWLIALPVWLGCVAACYAMIASTFSVREPLQHD